MEKHDKGEYIFIVPGYELNLPERSGKNPYKGLESFEEKDKELFYGRERVIKDLVQRIDNNNLIVVTGASGTGKSSVVKAGLLPALFERKYNIIPVIRPGQYPIRALERKLYESTLFNSIVTMANDINKIFQNLTSFKNVLVIDQFEELITRCSETRKDEFIKFLKLLLDSDKRNLLKIILTVRADFEPQFLKSDIKRYWKDARYTVPPLSIGELREIIEKPAIQEVLSIEPPGLVDQIVHEVIQSHEALPLLSFTLSELYRLSESRNDKSLHESDYNAIGGVIGALSTRAEYLYKSDIENQNVLRKILLRMVAVEGGEPVAKRLLMEELNFSKDENYRIYEVIDTLLEARLIYKNIDEEDNIYIELVHEALIRAWPTLWDWIKENDEKIILRNRVAQAAKDNSTKNGPLWIDDPRLDQVKADLNSPDSWLNNSEKNFIENSIRQKRQKRNRFIITLICIIIALSGLSGFAVYKAREASNKARIAQANAYTSQAQLKFEADPIAAIRYVEEAYRLDKNDNVMRVLSSAASSALKKPFYNINMKHNGYVIDGRFSPAGDRIVTASSDNTARLWDLHGNLLAEMPHDSVVYTTQFSPDGKRILTISRENSAALWDLKGNRLHRFEHDNIVTSAVFSPDGRMVLTASKDSNARLWDLQGVLIREYKHSMDLKTAEFSPDGDMILTLDKYRIARLWELEGKLYGTLKTVISADFSPANKQILTVIFNNTIRLWDWHGKLLHDFRKHESMISLAQFTPDGAKILVAYTNGTIKMFDLNGRPLSTFNGHHQNITSVSFSRDGARVITASDDHTARLWDLNGNAIAELIGHNDRVSSAVLSPNGTKILTASRDMTAKLWDLRDQPAMKLGITGDSAIFAPNGDQILIISRNSVKLVDLRENIVKRFDGHIRIVNSAVFSSNSAKILTASADGTARLWDINGNMLTQFNGHTSNVNSAVFSPDNTKILTASNDHTAKLWNSEGNLLADLNKHTSAVNSAVFSPDGSEILTASHDGTVKLWDMDGNLSEDWNIRSQVNRAVFSPDGKKILARTVVPIVLNLQTQSALELKIPQEIRTKIRLGDEGFSSALFSPDSLKVLAVSNDNTVLIWDCNGDFIIRFKGHEGMINTAVFSTDGKRVATASVDGTAKLWDLKGNILSNFDRHASIVRSALFSPDGSRILTVSADNVIKIWLIPEAIIQWLQKAQIPQLP